LSQSIGVFFFASAAAVLWQATTSQAVSQAKRPKPSRNLNIFQLKTIYKALADIMNIVNCLQYKRSLMLKIDRQFFWPFSFVEFI